MFDKVYLINLKRRPDRLANFRRLQKEHGWQLPEPIIFEAIEGDKVGVPAYFTQGGGAWGCCCSHVNILERCLMDDVGSVLVLGDDVTWFADCWERLEKFMADVPDDWSQCMLGGQHIHTPRPVSEGVVRCGNTQRTHAYVIRGQAMQSLLNLWYTCSVHIDWAMGGWQKGYKVYAPEPFIFGQSGGRSDISGNTNPTKYWISPDKAPVVHLTAPLAVVQKLRGYGFHTGYTRDENDLDIGLVGAAAAQHRDGALRRWLDTLSWEVASMEGTVTTVYHPDITADDVRKVHNEVIEVKGETVEECLKQVETLKLKTNRSATHVLLLRSSRSVVESLGGFHRGYWRDTVTGQDNGIREIATLTDKTIKLKEWFTAVGVEAERIGAAPMIWHPDITIEDVALATDRKIVEITANTAEEVYEQWRENV